MAQSPHGQRHGSLRRSTVTRLFKAHTCYHSECLTMLLLCYLHSMYIVIRLVLYIVYIYIYV